MQMDAIKFLKIMRTYLMIVLLFYFYLFYYFIYLFVFNDSFIS